MLKNFRGKNATKFVLKILVLNFFLNNALKNSCYKMQQICIKNILQLSF